MQTLRAVGHHALARLQTVRHNKLLPCWPPDIKRRSCNGVMFRHHPAIKPLRILLDGGNRDHQTLLRLSRAKNDRHVAARQQAMLRIGEFGAQHYAGGAGINPVIDRGQHFVSRLPSGSICASHACFSAPISACCPALL